MKIDLNTALEEMSHLDEICQDKGRYVHDCFCLLGKLTEKADPQGLLRVADADGAMCLRIAPADEKGEPSRQALVDLIAIKATVRGDETVTVYSLKEGKPAVLAEISANQRFFTEQGKASLVRCVNEGVQAFAPSCPGMKPEPVLRGPRLAPGGGRLS